MKKFAFITLILLVVAAFSVSSITVYQENPQKAVVLDITDPFSPKIIQNIRSDTTINNIMVYGRVVYLVEGSKVRILKIDENGEASSWEDYDLPYTVDSLDVFGRTIALSHGSALFLTDSRFQPLGTLSAGKSLKSVHFFDENHVLLVFENDGVGMVDIFKVSDPRLMWRLEVKDDVIQDLACYNDYIYVVGKKGLFFIIDVSDISKPKVLFYTKLLEEPLRVVKASGSNVYILFKNGELSVVDVSDPIEPRFVLKKAFGPGTSDLFVYKDLVYVARYNGLYVYEYQHESLKFVDYFPEISAKSFAMVRSIEIPTKEPGTVLWSYNAGSEIRSSPVSYGEAIFFSSINGTIYSVDLNGTFKWSYRTKFLINAPLVVDKDGRIVIGCWDNHLYIVSPDGRLVDRVKLGGDITKPVGVLGKRIYVGAEDGKVYAVEDGKIVWSRQFTGWPTTNILVDNEGAIYFGTSDGKIYSLSYSGNVLWVFHASSWVTSYLASDQVGGIYFGTADGMIYKITTKGELVWKYDVGSDITSGIVVDSFGRVMAGTKDGRLVVLDRKGNFQWQFMAKAQIRSTPAVSKEGNIYFGSDDGYIYALSMDGTLRWKYLTSGKVTSSPLILKNLVAFGSTDGRFYGVYDETEGLDDGPWPMCCGNQMHSKIVKTH